MFAKLTGGGKIFQAEEPAKEKMTHLVKHGMLRNIWEYVRMFIEIGTNQILKRLDLLAIFKIASLWLI